jgi:hypothetical protein
MIEEEESEIFRRNNEMKKKMSQRVPTKSS